MSKFITYVVGATDSEGKDIIGDDKGSCAHITAKSAEAAWMKAVALAFGLCEDGQVPLTVTVHPAFSQSQYSD